MCGETSVKERVQYHYLSDGFSDSHRCVGCCSVVVPQFQHDLGVGGAVSVGCLVWLEAVDTADRGVVARVSCSAVHDRVGVVLGGMGLGTYGTGVVAGSVALGRMPICLAFVASGGGAEGDVFGKVAFAVEHREAGSSEKLLGHFTYEGDDHGGSLFALTAVRAGEPLGCLAHSEGRVGIFDFGHDGFRGGGGWDAVDDEAGPSLADPGRCDREFVEGLLEDGQVGLIGGT